MIGSGSPKEKGESELAENISRIFREKEWEFPCPVCKNEKWYVLDDPVENLNSGIPNTNGQMIPIYTLACSSCGLVRQHIRQFLDSNRNGGTE